MAKGGARARSGPAPDPNALRRDRKDDSGWITLPDEGRTGPTPDWPLGDDVAQAQKALDHLRAMEDDSRDLTAMLAKAQLALFEAEHRRERELELWTDLWTRPQAVQWERNEQELEVAIFVRSFFEAEQPDAQKGKRDLVRQGLEALGLSLPGLHRNRWRIGTSQAQAAANEQPEQSPFTVIPGGRAG